LVEVRQTTGAESQLLGTFGNWTVLHQPQTLTDAAGQTTVLTYNSAGQLVTETNAKNETTTLGYDTNGYLTTVTGAIAGAVTSIAYDGYGRARTVTEPDGYSATTDYDTLDRPTRKTYPDGSYEAITYERLNASTYQDRSGRVTRYYYDSLGHLTATRDPLGRVISREWCGCGALEALIDPAGKRTRWERDLQGRLTREVRADGSAIEFLYETATSRLKRRTDANSQQTNYSYFLDDAVQQISYSNVAIATPSVTFTYDSTFGRVATRLDGSGLTTYTYRTTGTAAAGKVATIDGPLANDTISYEYDALARLTSRTLNGVTSTWTYDALGRLTSIAEPIGNFNFTYDGATARLASVAYPNGQASSYTYLGNVGDRRLQDIHHQTNLGATLSRFSYTYDAVGNISSWTQQSGTDAKAYDFMYDAADQLVSATYRTTGPSPTILKRQTYRYDAAANRTTEQVDDSSQTWAFDVMNRLTNQTGAGTMALEGTVSEPATVTIDGKLASVDGANSFSGSTVVGPGTTTVTVAASDASGNTAVRAFEIDASTASKSFNYDANGNLTGDGTRTFEWDAENRLVAVNIGTQRSEFTYDGLDRRVRIVEKENAVTVRDAHLIWDRTVIVEERLVTGAINRFFDYGEQHDGVARYLTRDHLGSIREVTDEQGTVVTRNDYDPYGRLTRTSGAEDSQFGYTGHFFHAASGLALPMYRAYDAGLGRWLSEDPLGFIDGPNVNGYVGNNPVVRVDEFGLQYDSVTRSLIEAIRRGDIAAIRNILEVSGDVLTAEWKAAAQQAIKQLQTPARDLIRASLKRSDSYAGELEEKTLEQLMKDGSTKAKKMIKLIKQSDRLMDKVNQCIR